MVSRREAVLIVGAGRTGKTTKAIELAKDEWLEDTNVVVIADDPSKYAEEIRGYFTNLVLLDSLHYDYDVHSLKGFLDALSPELIIFDTRTSNSYSDMDTITAEQIRLSEYEKMTQHLCSEVYIVAGDHLFKNDCYPAAFTRIFKAESRIVSEFKEILRLGVE